MDDTCRRVLGFLRSKFHVPDLQVPPDWIQGCVNFYNSNNSSSNIQAMLDFVAQQWLLADFQPLNLKSLPPKLSEKKLVTITGTHILQVKVKLYKMSRFNI